MIIGTKINTTKNIAIQVFVGVFAASLLIAVFIAIFDSRKHGANYELVLDKREWSCVESKTERYHTMIMVGKVPITQWHNREVCITMKRN